MGKFLKAKRNLVIEAIDTMYPSQLMVVEKSTFKPTGKFSQYFGYVLSGTGYIKSSHFQAKLSQDMYFSLNSDFELEVDGQVILFERFGYQGQTSIGGPIEKKGRLSYMDSCSATILIYPARLGDANLNLLYFPPGVVQSKHTHPTIRFGAVVRGEGVCHIGGEKLKLSKGDCFFIEEHEEHSFTSGSEGLAVIAYHPDSDWGPTDSTHPLINRTYLSTKTM